MAFAYKEGAKYAPIGEISGEKATLWIQELESGEKVTQSITAGLHSGAVRVQAVPVFVPVK